MKILIGTYDIAGWIAQYKKGFEKAGHSVTTAVSERSPFFDHKYDHVLSEIAGKGRYKKAVGPHQYIYKAVRKIQNSFADRSYRRYIRRLIDGHDMVVRLWHPFLEDAAEESYIRKKNKKLIRLFVGSDVRCFNAFQQQYDVSRWQFPPHFSEVPPGLLLTQIRTAEKYADLIYSVPDQAGLQLRPYFHLQVPVDISGIAFFNHKRNIPKVVHAPTIPYKKGTDIIEQTLEKLREEGIPFDFISVRDMPNSKVLELLTEADVLIDELVFHGPGGLSFEAMAAGCAVATRYLENSPGCFRPPVWSINAGNIYERLKRLLTDFDLRQTLIGSGREYVIKNNTAQVVAVNILRDLESKRPADYYPSFLRNTYIPANQNEAQEISEWTATVKDCDWYKKNILPGERAGLGF